MINQKSVTLSFFYHTGASENSSQLSPVSSRIRGSNVYYWLRYKLGKEHSFENASVTTHTTYLHVFFRLRQILGVLQKLSHVSHDWFFIWIHNVNIYESQYIIYIIMQPSRPDHIITHYAAVIKTHYHKPVYFATARLTCHWQKLICNEHFFLGNILIEHD